MLRILRDQQEIDDARRYLGLAGCDTSRGWRRGLFCTLYTLRYRQRPPAVALNKSWDVWQMLTTIHRHVPDRRARALDAGSFNSEIPLALWNAGYRNLKAADLDPHGRAIRWYGNRIDFRRENFYEANVAGGTLDALTALSVIEHGYDQQRLLRLIRRVLRPGGIACLSTDYHEDPITIPADCRIFGLPYRIFCRRDVENLLSDAQSQGLTPLGDLRWERSEHPIAWLGHRMTFLFMALRKAS